MIEDPNISFIRTGLAQPGKTQTGLADFIGVHASAISKVLHGRRKLSTGELALASEYLGVEAPSSEVTLSVAGLVPAAIVGTTDAGAFRQVDDFDQSPPKIIHLPPDEKYPSARLLVFDVSGDSMNDLKPRPILDGDRAVCVAFEDISHRTPLRDGMVVVVQRTRDGGHIREWSVKQIEFYADRIEFNPRSTNPRYKPIVVPHDYQADDGTEVEIIGLVRRLTNELPDF